MDEERTKNKCYHCGEPLGPKDKVCPRCGAAVDEDRTPKTIYELRAYCARHNMPLEKMRFFIGEDCREPKAYGIFQTDDGDFVVYKNKADGVRAVRYRGPDEARAVNELYQKLIDEIAVRRQKKRVQRGDAPLPPRKKQSRSGTGAIVLGIVFTVIFAIAVAVLMLAFKLRSDDTRRGYYYYDDEYYYSQNDVWYGYDDTEGWAPVYPDEELEENAGDYYVGRSFDEDYDVEDFSGTPYYDESSAFDDWDDDDWDDWDDDDWDDWDDDDSDWDSDW